MTDFQCMRCLRTSGVDVRLIEHGTDDMPLCKDCFEYLRNAFSKRAPTKGKS